MRSASQNPKAGDEQLDEKELAIIRIIREIPYGKIVVKKRAGKIETVRREETIKI